MTGRLFTIWLFTVVSLYVEASPVSLEEGDAPRISGLQVAPAAGPRGTRYTIAIKIIDPQGSGDIAAILYQVREQSELIKMEINDAGEHGDRVAGDGIYTGVSKVPDSAARGTHSFHLFVRDRAGHQSNILQYRFTVEQGARVISI